MRLATLGIITREDKVLLGLKRGEEIGNGTLNGPGGKQKPGEMLVDCLVREVTEEVGILLVPAQTKKVAVITFYAGDSPDFEVHVFRTSFFSGEPRETEKMIPGWYDINHLPFQQMLESDSTWFPKAIHEERPFLANVYYRSRAKGFLRTEFLP